MAFVEDNTTLKLYDVKNRKTSTLLEGYAVYHPVWSPDENYMALQISDENYNTDIYIITLDGMIFRNVSLHPEYDHSPEWSLKGDALFWISNRFGRETVQRLKLTDFDPGKSGSYAVREKQEEIFATNLDMRNIKMLSGDKKLAAVIYTDDEGAVYSIDVSDGSLKQLSPMDSPQSLRVNYVNNNIYYLTKYGFKSISSEGGGAKSYQAPVYMYENRDQLYHELLRESWVLLRERFYDPAMHNTDWESIWEKYEKRLDGIKRKDSLYSLIREMLGELNASHLGIWGADERSSNPMLLTGEWGGITDSGLKVRQVFKYGPAWGKVKKGDRILEVEGRSVKSLSDLDRALMDRSGKLTSFVFQKAGAVPLLCVSPRAMSAKFMKETDHDRKEYVDLKTNGRAAYIHLRRMSMSDLEQFKEELGRDGRDKSGLILDVRDNGGGRIAEYILDMLERQPYAYSESRKIGVQKNWPSKYAWTKPIVVLINERSFSNAEIFPAGFKALGLGKVIGVTTAGGVIGTVDIKLVDGSTFRTPFVKWITAGGKNMENLGIEPDIYVRNMPQDVVEGRDAQLDKAIKELKKLMK